MRRRDAPRTVDDGRSALGIGHRAARDATGRCVVSKAADCMGSYVRLCREWLAIGMGWKEVKRCCRCCAEAGAFGRIGGLLILGMFWWNIWDTYGSSAAWVCIEPGPACSAAATRYDVGDGSMRKMYSFL